MESILAADKQVFNGHNSDETRLGDGNGKVLIAPSEDSIGRNTGDGNEAFYLRLLETDMFYHLWCD